MENIDSEKKRSYIGYIITVMAILSFFIILTNKSINYSTSVLFIALSSIYITVFVIKPRKQKLKKDEMPSFITNLTNIIRVILVFSFVIALYKIMMTKDYNLKYSYFICGTSFISITVMNFIEEIIKRYKSRKSKGKKLNVLYILGKILLGFLALTLSFQFLIKSCNIENKEIILKGIKFPEYITIYENEDIDTILYSERIKINDKILIKEIFEEINDKKIKNLRYADYFNYIKLSFKNPYYNLLCRYKTNVKYKDETLENGYINEFEMFSNGYIVIKERNWDHNFFSFKSSDYVYRVKLSQNTIDKILNYINSKKLAVEASFK